MRVWVQRFSAISFGLIISLVLLEFLIRVAFSLMPYSVQVILRDVHRHPFTDELLLPEPIWHSAEAYQLIARPNVDDELHYPDPRVGFHISTKNWLDPGSHVGFRVPDVSWEPQWPVDAVAVGDSFTFCYTEYEDCWVRRLETEHNLSMVNLGLVATGSLSRRNVLNTFGLLYEPRFVIWQWYGNDFNDDYGMIQPITAESTTATPTNPLQTWLDQNSAVYHLSATLFVRFASETDLQPYTRFENQYYSFEDGVEIGFGQSYILEAFDLTLAKNQKGQAETEAVLLSVNERLAAEQIPWVILLIPSKEEVYAKWTEPQLGAAQLAKLAQGRQEMLSFCAVHGLACLDSTAVLQKAAEQSEPIYYEEDTHLAPRGNEILTAAIWEFLLQEQLVQE